MHSVTALTSGWMRGRRSRWIGAGLLLGLALPLAGLLVLGGCGGAPRENIVLIVIDTLRPDRMGCYGAERNTTPFIDSLAARGVRFDRAYAPAPWTVPSMASLMTSLQPRDHGCRHGIVTKTSFGLVDQEILDESFETLAERLKAMGYRTFGISANPHLAPEMGFAQGFDHYEMIWMADAAAVNDVAGKWSKLIQRGRKPYFLLLHYFDPHSPYYAKEPWITEYGGASTNHLVFSGLDPAERNKVLSDVKREVGDDPAAMEAYMVGLRADLLNLYDSEIAFCDDHIRQLFEELRVDLDRSTVIITADHGEEFFEHHGIIGHGRTLYEHAVRIPLIWSQPGGKRGVLIQTPVSLLDVLPTTVELAGGKKADDCEGISLANAIMKGQEPEARSFILETERHSDAVWAGLLDEDWKYMVRGLTLGQTESILVNLARNPEETIDWSADQPEIAGQMRKTLKDWSQAKTAKEAQRRSTWLDPKREQELRSLGYLK